MDVCNAVLDVWQPTKDKKVIINIPTTVENAMPHVFAGQVEYVDKNLKYRDGVVLSLHPHNDRGCGVATAEMGILAGADRIEGTLFGNGERTGNVDIVTLALNMFSQGVDPGLDFTDIPKIREIYERLTRMQEIWYLPHFPVPIRMPSQKVWHGVKQKKEITGPYRICRSIRRTSEELTIKMLSVSTASQEKAV